jgi:cytochrome P450
MCHDPRVWDEPDAFKPERFLGEIKEPMFDPLTVIFGFGRRYVHFYLPGTGSYCP